MRDVAIAGFQALSNMIENIFNNSVKVDILIVLFFKEHTAVIPCLLYTSHIAIQIKIRIDERLADRPKSTGAVVE